MKRFVLGDTRRNKETLEAAMQMLWKNRLTTMRKNASPRF